MRSCAVILFFVLALSACGGTNPPTELPFASDAATSMVAGDEVDDRDPLVIENDELIAFHAGWICELQRRTFPDLNGREVALDEAIAENGLSQAAYDDFLETLAGSQTMRDEVLKLYGERCRA